MRVFLAGATGAIGRALVPKLIADGHQVIGMTRSPQKTEALRSLGAEAVVCDALDSHAVEAAVRDAKPEAIVHELTAIPQLINPRKIKRDFALTDRLRTEGTHNLIAAGAAAGVTRFVAQSIAFAYEPTENGRLHAEDDPLYTDAPPDFRRTLDAVCELERAVLAVDGTVLRYGYFYGPGTAVARDGSLAREAHRRRLPVIGSGSGAWSFIHIDDAARATIAALRGPSGVYNIVDDEPALVRDWIPAFSQAVGAPKPMRIPVWIARIGAGGYGVLSMTRTEGASNARAKRELSWSPAHPTWRGGFRDGLG